MKTMYMYLTINNGTTYVKTKKAAAKIELQGAKVVKCEWVKRNGFYVLANDIDGLEYYTATERATLRATTKGVY